MRKYFKLFLTTLITVISLFFGMESASAAGKVHLHFVDVKEGVEPYTLTKTYDMVKGQTKTLAMNQIFSYGDSTRPYTGLRYATSTEESDKEANGTNKYEFIGWFDGIGSDATEITPEYVATGEYATIFTSVATLPKTDANKPNALKLSNVIYNEDEDVDVYFYAHWHTLKLPVLHFNYVDNVSTGSGSWANENGTAAGYKHTFSEPEGRSHYQFLYWKEGENTYNDGDVFTFDLSSYEYNWEDTLTAYAWWQSSITLNIYIDNKLESSEESFETVSIPSNINPTKDKYVFDGWVDEKGNKVTETSFAPEAASYEKVTPKVVNLYASFKKETVTLDINKTWNDNDNADNIRPDHIDVIVYANDVEYETITLNDDNKWTYPLTVDKYDDNGDTITYRLEEVKVDDYDTEIDNYNITNTIKEKGKVVVKYVEKETKEELDSTTTEDYVDREYETSAKEIENYEYLNEVEGNTTGTYTKEDIIVTYYYKAIKGKVVVKYVDVDGKALTDNTVLEGKVGTNYQTEEKDFNEYVLKETKGDTKGTFSKEEKEVTYVYEMVGIGGDDLDNKEVPPQTGLGIDAAPYVITIMSCLGLVISKKYTISE